MKPLKFIPLFALALLAGCQTTPSTTATRIEEKAKVYAALPADVQKKLQDGMVETGYTANMVYIALGRPTEVAVTADGKVGIWTYKDFYPSAAVSPRPFYSIRAHPVGRDPLAVGARSRAAGEPIPPLLRRLRRPQAQTAAELAAQAGRGRHLCALRDPGGGAGLRPRRLRARPAHRRLRLAAPRRAETPGMRRLAKADGLS